MKTKIGCSDQALMPRKRKILTHVWYQNKAHIRIFKDGFPDFSFYPPTAFWEGLKRRNQPIRKFVLSLPKQERVQHGDQSRECRAILRKPMPTVETFPSMFASSKCHKQRCFIGGFKANYRLKLRFSRSPVTFSRTGQ